MHHFVNGGGGAYLSFGTALALAGSAGDCRLGILPEHSGRSSRRSRQRRRAGNGRRGGGRNDSGVWPFSAEWLSAAFDANVAPFYQSFIEVRVEPSKGVVRLLPYGVHGRLRWRDMEVSAGTLPSDAVPDSPVEWVVKMGQQR